jgi:hypothetical protein
LFWHFTDQFYHTDNDRIDKVSKSTLKNVGTTALIAAFELINSDENTAIDILKKIQTSAVSRLNEELKQSKIALQKGDSLSTQIEIINAWEDWYVKAANTTTDMVSSKTLISSQLVASKDTIKAIAKSIRTILNKK